MTQTQGPGMDSQHCKERKMRRLWKSVSEEPGVGLTQDCDERAEEDRKRFGSVLPALRLQLAEQGDPGAQLELARELLVAASLARREGAEEEAGSLEEDAVFWLIRAAEEGEEEAMETLQVGCDDLIMMTIMMTIMMIRGCLRRAGG